MADNNTIARPYARAAFELANADGELGKWSDALAAAALLIDDGQASKFLDIPVLSPGKRLTFLSDLIGAAGTAGAALIGTDSRGRNFLRLLLENGRVSVLPEISEHFEMLKAQVENTVDVTVTSAAPLSDARKSEITSALKRRLGRKVRLETEIDENLIGGAVIRAGDVVIDGSVRSRLEGLANALIA